MATLPGLREDAEMVHREDCDVSRRLGEAGYAVDIEEFPARVSIDQWLAACAGLSTLAAL